jgi:hypothetical protein
MSLALALTFTAISQSVPLFEAFEARALLLGEAHHHDGGGEDPCADGSACGDGCPCQCCPGHGPLGIVWAADPGLASQSVHGRPPACPDDLTPAPFLSTIFRPPR